MKKIALSMLLATSLIACDIDQKKEAELPEIDVDVETEPGQLPTFDVDWADVNVGTKTRMVEVPKVVVVMEEEEIEVPYIDVDMPNDDEVEEMTLAVEAEVDGVEHNIAIQQIWATGDRLYVISELTPTTTSLGDKTMRVSDRIVLNAPDLNVKHIIVGEKPNRVFNDQFKYVKDLNAFKMGLDNPTVIYTR